MSYSKRKDSNTAEKSIKWSRAIVMIFKKLNKKERSPIAPLRSTSTWPLHTGSSPNRIPLFLKGDTHCFNTTDMILGDTNIFLNITYVFFYIWIILYMLNQIYIHNITTLFDKWRMTNENNMCSKSADVWYPLTGWNQVWSYNIGVCDYHTLPDFLWNLSAVICRLALTFLK